MPLLKLVKSKVNFAKQTEEYYNAIRTNIQFSGAQMKVIAVSSVEAGEGKSTTSVNLAISFASVGLRTLLIDADTRNSVLSGTFKSNAPYKGLSNFLSGNADFLMQHRFKNIFAFWHSTCLDPRFQHLYFLWRCPEANCAVALTILV